MILIKLINPLSHDGKFYKAGEALKVSEKQATRLIGLKWAEKFVDATIPVIANSGDIEDTSDDEPDTGDAGASGDDADVEGELPPKPIEKMTKAELEAELSAKGVPFNPRASVVELRTLLEEALATS